jgi:hypothetical protein
VGSRTMTSAGSDDFGDGLLGTPLCEEFQCAAAELLQGHAHSCQARDQMAGPGLSWTAITEMSRGTERPRVCTACSAATAEATFATNTAVGGRVVDSSSCHRCGAAGLSGSKSWPGTFLLEFRSW